LKKVPTNLQQLLDCISAGVDTQTQVSLGDIIQTIGNRSFGPLLLLPGLILISPLSGIPGMATVMGLLVLVIATQLLFGRQYFWLPRWMLRRSFSQKTLLSMIKWLRPPARVIDRLLRPRLGIFIQDVATYLIAIMCLVIALAMPAMELIPFSASSAGVALATFGLSLIANDGLLALIAFTLSGTAFFLLLQSLL